MLNAIFFYLFIKGQTAKGSTSFILITVIMSVRNAPGIAKDVTNSKSHSKLILGNKATHIFFLNNK